MKNICQVYTPYLYTILSNRYHKKPWNNNISPNVPLTPSLCPLWVSQLSCCQKIWACWTRGLWCILVGCVYHCPSQTYNSSRCPIQCCCLAAFPGLVMVHFAPVPTTKQNYPPAFFTNTQQLRLPIHICGLLRVFFDALEL